MDITIEVIDALNDVWDEELSMVDMEAMKIEDVKCPSLCVLVCNQRMQVMSIVVCVCVCVHANRKGPSLSP